MSHVVKDRVRETATTTGTGTLTLGGAPTGYQTFSAAVGNGNTCPYTIVHQTDGSWESGIGTIAVSGNTTLARTTVLASSNSGSAVNFAAGTKDVILSPSVAFYPPNDGPLAGFRNVLTNGAFEVWQRGTASTNCSAGSRTYLADRWYVNPAGADIQQLRSATVPSGSRAPYSLELTGQSSVTTVLVGQRIEAGNIPPIARRVTYSALVYNGSGAAFTPNLLLGTPSAADDFTSVTNRLTQALQSCADASWTRVEHNVDISAYTNLSYGLQVELQIPSGSLVSGDTVRVTEIQLEPGYFRTPFECRGLAMELLRCERYWQQSYAIGTAAGTSTLTGAVRFHAWAANSSQRSHPFRFNGRMRKAPTMVVYSSTGASGNIRDATSSADIAASIPTISDWNALMSIDAGGVSSGDDLRFHFTANAEL